MGRARPWRGDDALTDGFSRLAERPRYAAPGNFADPEEAADYDATGEMLEEYGGRNALKRRRHRDLEDDGYPY